MIRTLEVSREVWPIRGTFRISRGARTEAVVVVARISQDGAAGMGECVPYARYGESVESVMAQIEKARALVERGGTRAELAAALPGGAARNALDCALWDLEAKRAGKPVWQLAGLPAPKPVTTAFTLSVDTPANMAQAADAARARPLLKIKLTGEGDLERVAAVRNAAPNSRLIVDANEAWDIGAFARFAPALAKLGVTLIEQPLHADRDAALVGLAHPLPLCADEACHDRASLPHLAGKYEAVNIKLDKTGGLTEALALRAAATVAGMRIMVGCMVGTSLSMAPAHLLAQGADWADIDGPLLLARDRSPGLVYDGSTVSPPAAALWG
ncbi:MAG: L-Ala-D/L-Glu epimerase [Rhodospirillales bacterium]|nr:L-Ala-D/L-Glu epimerase [Rhodospirillales bacterium]